jgi:alpha-maltose-1-phosphate synthase
VKIGLVTKEWPPEVYGGAGVHVTFLAAALKKYLEVEVHCFGEKRNDAISYQTPEFAQSFNPAMQALVSDLEISENLENVDLVHSHTWYANMAGHFAQVMYKKPHVITAHSLEPDRPWKAEQLGAGYRLSSWAEKTAYHSADAIIAVSEGMKKDILRAYPDLNPEKIHPILNGIDTEKYAKKIDADFLAENKIPERFVLFVGRITRQKGLSHLLKAFNEVNPEYGLVLAAGNADEESIGSETKELIQGLQKQRKNIIWFEKMLPVENLITLLSAADLFVCPSIYEPLGIVNLEAMACETAVLASDVGGIPEVVKHQKTGELVHWGQDPAEFQSALASKINELMSNRELLVTYGKAGRLRAIEKFSWDSIAAKTHALYQKVIAASI